ncbi:MAG: YtxH domain-containing protein [Deltaproteobacteria bacterium]|nr:YtxH domain-containing protein [Deltaproteobacteria bacterium]
MAMDDCIKGFLIGGLIGAAAGILYAPKSGKETREEIRHSAEELMERAKQQYDDVSRKIEQLAEREKELYVGKKERLKKALEAGREAFKQA